MTISIEQLTDKQRIAVERSIDVQQRCLGITGEAGTGKTTLMDVVYKALIDAGYTCDVAAPTGKAARRVREATSIPAMTVHKLLEYGSPTEYDLRTGKAIDNTYPSRNEHNNLEADVVMVDEYAMVNRELHANLVRALKPGARLITLGDIQQLPPIETSAALAREPTAFKMILDKFNGVYLDKNHRQNEGSAIYAAARNVLRGLPPKDGNDFKRIITERPVDEVINALDTADYNALNNQIITPANKSWIGTYKLNLQLQDMLQTESRELVNLERHPWDKTRPVRVGVGDKVVLNKNWYALPCDDGSLGMFNGEVGIIEEITELQEIIINLEDRRVTIPPIIQFMIGSKLVVGFPQRDLHLAYALTTHKCQGSEFNNVIYVMNKSVYPLLNRRNLYTGITRARTFVTLISDMKSLSTSLYVQEPRIMGELS